MWASNDKAAADAMMAMLRNMTKNQTSIKVDLSNKTNSGTVKAGFGFKGWVDAPVEEFGALIQKALDFLLRGLLQRGGFSIVPGPALDPAAVR